MTCINCQTRIQNALKKQPGISQATVGYETETADILYDSSVISLEQIQGLIDELGYSARFKKHRAQSSQPDFARTWHHCDSLFSFTASWYFKLLGTSFVSGCARATACYL